MKKKTKKKGAKKTIARKKPVALKKAAKKKSRSYTTGHLKKQTKLVKERFLKAYAVEATITGAAKVAKISRQTHYDWLESDEKYKERFGEAEEIAIDALEQEARRRAIKGVREPVGWYKGEPGGYIRKYSDTLLIFLLKGRKPEMYRERFEHTGKDGGPLEQRVTFYVPKNDREESS